MTIQYTPRGVCSRSFTIQVEDGLIQSVQVVGGCSGNLQGISMLLKGMPVEEAIRRMEGIRCGSKATSCPDQLAQALKQAQGGTPVRRPHFLSIRSGFDMTIQYTPRGVCSRSFTIQVEDGLIQSVQVVGGCSGNLQGISMLLKGMPVEEAIRRMEGIRCGSKATSCPDQLAQALKQAQG